MVRQYKKRLGARPYRNYTEQTLNEAVREVLDKNLSLREASQKYGIHRNVLWNKAKQAKVPKENTPPKRKPGGQPVFTDKEEERFVAHAVAVSSFGFPVTMFDLRCIVKSYLDRTGRKVSCFKNGDLPGYEWSKKFFKRHDKVISQRTSKNINYSRASTDEEKVSMFLDNLKEETEGVPASNIWNYDETNLQDDPGSEKHITRRGAKYPEMIRNSSKACTSIMYCGNAAGEMTPVYVNYKAEKIWTTWTEKGPDGARYNRSKSGWFDANTFEDWFVSMMLPSLKKQEGKKILIGDNLSAHFNYEVLRLCEEHNITFIALPPNATHLLQPLDVAFFRPLKVNWRKVLTDWKMTASGSRCTNIPKDEFPGLLKKLEDAMKPNQAENLRAGFRKTGIFPNDKHQVLKRLPSYVAEDNLRDLSACIGEVFMDELKKKRAEVTEKKTTKRKKMLDVPAGKSIGLADLEAAAAARESAQPGTSGSSKKRGHKSNKNQEAPKKRHNQGKNEESENGNGGRKRNKQQSSGQKRQKKQRKEENIAESEESEIENSDAYSLQESGESSESFSSEEFDVESRPSVSTGTRSGTPTEDSQHTHSVGDDVLVLVEGKVAPAKILAENAEGYVVSIMEKSGTSWKWTDKSKKCFRSKDDIVMPIEPPKKISNRGLFEVKEVRLFSNQ